MGEPTLQRFLGEARPAKSSAASASFAQVTVSENRAPPAGERVVLRGPHGVVVEDVSVETLAQLLKRLSCSG
jgi:hypothetical protein